MNNPELPSVGALTQLLMRLRNDPNGAELASARKVIEDFAAIPPTLRRLARCAVKWAADRNSIAWSGEMWHASKAHAAYLAKQRRRS